MWATVALAIVATIATVAYYCCVCGLQVQYAFAFAIASYCCVWVSIGAMLRDEASMTRGLPIWLCPLY